MIELEKLDHLVEPLTLLDKELASHQRRKKSIKDKKSIEHKFK